MVVKAPRQLPNSPIHKSRHENTQKSYQLSVSQYVQLPGCVRQMLIVTDIVIVISWSLGNGLCLVLADACDLRQLGLAGGSAGHVRHEDAVQ